MLKLVGCLRPSTIPKKKYTANLPWESKLGQNVALVGVIVSNILSSKLAT